VTDSGGPLGVLGGSFDPVHFGHLRLAVEFLERLNLAAVRFVPVGVPPHRNDSLASADARVEMLRIAIADQPAFEVDARECRRKGPSYTVDTLRDLRQELGDRPLCLLLGMDAFVKLPTWHRWRELLDFAHLCVAQRPGTPPLSPADVDPDLGHRSVTRHAALHAAPAGSVLVATIPMLDISATQIRALIAGDGNPRYLLPKTVLTYIYQYGLYRECNA
jgi:nicotinate-nucleotide adenylyltransferase